MAKYTIVINDENVSQEQIREYLEKENITEDYEIITREEYYRRKSAEPVYVFRMPPEPPKIQDLTGAIREQERKERQFQKNQQKLARRFYRK